MDQIKKFLENAIAHRFWIAIGTAVFVGGIAWYMTQSKLMQLYAEQESLIKSKYGDLERVRSAVPSHPNESSRVEMERMIGSLTDDVRQAWEEQYRRQTEYMRWPDIGLPRLITKLQKYYPVELTLEYPEQPRDITEGEKTSFSKYFDEQMPKLAEIIGVRWIGTSSSVASAGGMGMGGPAMGGGDSGSEGAGDFGGSGFGMGSGGMMGGGLGGRRPASRDVIRWSKSSQDELLNSIRLWQGDKPNVYQMIYTQENVWILEGLFNIIAKTNVVPETQKPASANIQAAVKEIEFIRIGSSAIGDAGDIFLPSGPSAGMGMGGGDDDGSGMGGFGMGMASGGYGADGDMDGEFGGGMGMGGMGMGGMAEDSGAGMRVADPAHRRYVDAAFKPISGADLRNRIKSESPEDAYFAVAKRVPVRMRVTLDIRRLQDFIANCGNEGMMLEVRQVRLGNTSAATIGSGGGAGGSGGMGMGAMGMSMGGPAIGGAGDGDEGAGSGFDGMDDGMGMGGMGMGGMGMGGMGMGGMGGPGAGSALRSPRRNTNEIKVEVYGIVYLFYPVNIDRLGLGKIEDGFELQDSVEDVEDVASIPAQQTQLPDTEQPEGTAVEGTLENGNSIPNDISN
jgi:hypothetical protein